MSWFTVPTHACSWSAVLWLKTQIMRKDSKAVSLHNLQEKRCLDDIYEYVFFIVFIYKYIFFIVLGAIMLELNKDRVVKSAVWESSLEIGWALCSYYILGAVFMKWRDKECGDEQCFSPFSVAGSRLSLLREWPEHSCHIYSGTGLLSQWQRKKWQRREAATNVLGCSMES